MAQNRKPGWWYPWIFVGCFGLVVAVNGTMAYFATTTFTGLSTDNAYEKGRLYNRNLAMAKEQAALKWTVETKVVPVAGERVKADIRISYRDRDGKPLDNLAVQANVERPTAAGYDHDILLPFQGDGVYGGVFELPLHGVWDLEIVALGDGVAYQHAQRFVLP